MKQTLSIKQFTAVMFFDNGTEVSNRTKKVRTTKEINEMQHAVSFLNKQLTEDRHYGYYLGTPYTRYEILNMSLYIMRLKDLRKAL
jgi:hypothetical protein